MIENIGIGLIFFTPIIPTYQTYIGENDIKQYPYFNIVLKLLVGIILFSINWKFNINTKAIKREQIVYYLPLIDLGFFSVILSSIFLCCYIYFLYKNDIRKSIERISAFLIGVAFSIYISTYFIQIPLISHILIVSSYTFLNLYPFIKVKEIYSTRDYKLINYLELYGIMIFNFYYIQFNAKNSVINYLQIIAIINSLISIIELIIYIYLYYKENCKGKQDNEMDANVDSNQKIVHLIGNNNQTNSENHDNSNDTPTPNSNNYQPPSMNNDGITDLV